MKNQYGRTTTKPSPKNLKKGETLVKVAFLCEDETYFTEYMVLNADPENPADVQKALHSCIMRSWRRLKRVIWFVVVEDHHTLLEILEGL